MQSAAARWREFKSRLTKVYIVPYLDQPEMLKYPPQDYKFINADHWTQFVTERTKPAFLELRKTQQARRRMNKYPHRLSRKGYVGLVAELKAKAELAQAEPEEASTITDEDELYDRCETWVAARVTKDGKFADEETQKKAEEIIELKEKVSTRETSLMGIMMSWRRLWGRSMVAECEGLPALSTQQPTFTSLDVPADKA
ncbi:PREDICTED: uncharacterized protein LOC101299265 [Fragaria vesca subsp. vesca]